MSAGSTLAWALFAAVVLAALAAVAGAGVLAARRGRGVANTALVVLMGAVAAWCLSDLVVALAGLGLVGEGAARAAFTPALSLIAVSVAAFWVLARSVADRGWRPTPRVLAALAVHPLAVLAGSLAAPLSPVLYRPGSLEPGSLWLDWVPGPLFWAHALYSYALLARSGVVLVRARRAGGPLLHRQVGRLLLCLVVPLPFNLVTTVLPSGAVPDLTALGFAVAGLAAADALLRHGLLQLVPIARAVVLEGLADAVVVTDPDGRVLDVNRSGETLLRALGPLPGGPLTGLPVALLLAPWEEAGGVPDGEHAVDLPGRRAVLDVRTEDLRDGRGGLVGRVLVARDVSELARLRDSLGELARRDELTGLHNRRHLIDRLEAEVAEAAREGRDLCAVMLDIDHFKSVNDLYGHQVGDDLLRAVGAALVGSLRAGDLVARVGGEEFVVLLPGAGSEQAMARAEVLRERCSAAAVPGPGGAVRRTVSIGVAGLATLREQQAPLTGAALLRAADRALYAAKEAGRDRVVLAA